MSGVPASFIPWVLSPVDFVETQTTGESPRNNSDTLKKSLPDTVTLMHMKALFFTRQRGTLSILETES